MSTENNDITAEKPQNGTALSREKRRKYRGNAKFSHALFLRVIKRIEGGAFARQAIAGEGIHHSTFYSHLKDNPDYPDALKSAQLCGPVNLAEGELYRRGVKGFLKPVYQGGKKVGTIREYSDAALFFYLKAAWPEKYARLEGDTTTVNMSQTVVTPAQLAAEQRNAALLARFENRGNGDTGAEPHALPPTDGEETE